MGTSRIVLCLTFLSSIILLKSQFQPTPILSTTLTTSNTSNNGATLTISDTNSVTTDNNQWNIESPVQDNWPMLLNLNTSWGFHSNEESIITLTLSGNNPTGTDEDIYIAFSVGDSQYFAIFFTLDNNLPGDADNPIWPNCGDPLQSGSVYEQVVNEEFTTNNRFGNVMLSGWEYLSDTSGDMDNGMPITITLRNQPNLDRLIITVESGASANTQTCTFTSSFDTNQGMQIYFAGDGDAGETTVTFDQIDITYSFDLTYDPTMDPSSNPTQEPTNQPSSEPTGFPSKTPSETPTIEPTLDPTLRPSNPPSSIPSQAPVASIVMPPTYPALYLPSLSPTAEKYGRIHETTSSPTTQSEIQAQKSESGEIELWIWIVIGGSGVFCCVIGMLMKTCIDRYRKRAAEMKISRPTHQFIHSNTGGNTPVIPRAPGISMHDMKKGNSTVLKEAQQSVSEGLFMRYSQSMNLTKGGETPQGDTPQGQPQRDETPESEDLIKTIGYDETPRETQR